MASLDYRLNPLYTILECSSCGALYNKSCGCSKGGLVDKFIRDPNKTPDSSQRPPIVCVKCGNPVEGPSCQGCALWRKKLKEVWFTTLSCMVINRLLKLLRNCGCSKGSLEDKILVPTLEEVFQDFQDTSESSDDDTNVVNVHREPFVVKQGPGVNSSQSPPQINHNCCYECGDSLDGIFSQRCTCKSCGKGAHIGYNFPPKVSIICTPEPCNQTINFLQDFHDFQQQYPCCENCGGPHETYQCQPMNEDYYHEQNSCYDPNSFGFDQFQPPQYTVNHPIFNARNELLNSQNKLMEQMTSICDMVGQYMQKKEEEKRIAEDQAAKDRYWKIPICYDDDDDEESSIPLKDIIISGLPPCVAVTPVLITEEPVDSLIIEDEHLDSIPATELDEVIKSSVENLVPAPSESEDASNGQCDLPVCDDFPKSHLVTFSNPLFDIDDDCTSSDDESFSEEDVPMENFKIFSNPLFDLDEEIIATEVNLIQNEVLDNAESDHHLRYNRHRYEVLDSIDSIPPGIDHFDAESDLLESLLNRDISIDSSPKIDSFLDEFAGELTLLKSIPPGIDDDNLDPEGEIHLVEKLLYDNSSPRPLKELNVENSIESFSPSPIPVEDSDSLMEEIDLFLIPDNSMPPGIENDDYDSEGDILFLEELLSNDSPSLPENESFHFDIPSSPRPPAKPPDDGIYFEPDTGLLTTKVVGDISEHYVLMPKLLPTQPTLCPVNDTLIPFSSKNEDKVLLSSHRDLKALNESPMMISGGDIPLLDVLFLHFYPL
ncbi:hypothetical protein Tco_0352260 [Tanacetum coccineum]